MDVALKSDERNLELSSSNADIQTPTGACLLVGRYGFHKESAGGVDTEGQKKARLLDIFGHWTEMVTDLIRATPEDDVLRRDIFDRPPIFKWTQARLSV